jgi:hypothetical protein
MKNSIVIDGVDIYKEYGVVVLSNINKVALTPPEVIELTSVEWYEGGISVDNTERREFETTRKISFDCVQYKVELYGKLLEFLKSTPYHTIGFQQLGIEKTLRLSMVSSSKLLSGHYIQEFTMTFTDDAEDITQFIYSAQLTAVKNNFGDSLTINNTNFDKYGFTLLEGSLDDIFSQNMNDRVKDAKHSVTNKIQEITLSVGCSGVSIETFVGNYYSLLRELTKEGWITIKGRYLDVYVTLEGWYKSINISEIYANNSEIFCKFDIGFNAVKVDIG